MTRIKLDTWEGWHFHHLARRVKTFGLDQIAYLLEKAGWKLTKGESISEEAVAELEKALKR